MTRNYTYREYYDKEKTQPKFMRRHRNTPEGFRTQSCSWTPAGMVENEYFALQQGDDHYTTRIGYIYDNDNTLAFYEERSEKNFERHGVQIIRDATTNEITKKLFINGQDLTQPEAAFLFFNNNTDLTKKTLVETLTPAMAYFKPEGNKL